MTNWETHVSGLAELVDDSGLLVGKAVSDRYQVDWSGEHPVKPSLVLRPHDASAISRVLSYCNKHRLPIVTQGGMTGLSGGATPQPGEIVLSLERLNGVIEIDEQNMTMTVKSGTPLQVIQQAALDTGLRFPLDLGARGSCHIGGNVSTNAGGNQVVRFGNARALTLGLEAVLANGEIIRSMNKMIKNSAGYDLKHLFIGSEGTLGIITELVIRLYPGSNNNHTALCALPDFDSTAKLLRSIMTELPGVTSFEVMWDKYVDAVCVASPAAMFPFDQRHGMYVLLEAEGCSADQFQSALANQLESELITDALIASSKKDTADFWALRDGVADLMAGLDGFATFDVGLPISAMEAFIDATDTALNQRLSNVQHLPLGHIADGNLHFITWTENAGDVDAIYDTVYRVVEQFSGTVSAEHGIGMSKRPYLSMCRNEGEIALMHLLKSTLDPNHILNPGRIIGGPI